MPPRPYVLSEATWDDVRAASYEVAILPWGATEAHNRHLPYGTDNIEAEAVAVRAAGKAWERGARAVVLPTVPFGVQTGQREIPLCLNMNPSTQAAVIRDLLPALSMHGVRKLLILNGHGGNDFRQIIRELQPGAGLLLCQANWYNAVKPGPYFDEPGDHAGELETSVMQHVAPDLVRPLSTAGPGSARPFTIEAFRDGSAWTPRHWIEVTDDTGVGNPASASAEKGERFLAAVVDWLSDFLVELAAADPGNLHESPSDS
ncbi:MAG TPA: creatininase family protein [Gemmatimonadales bacterium]|nr:creatininase family protein [Gemmatimonadales bacterium]